MLMIISARYSVSRPERLAGVRRVASPNCDERPDPQDISLLVIHGISLPPGRFREDVTVIGMPLTEICNAVYSDPRQRQLFKNIVYVGALSVLLDMDHATLETLVAERYKSKPKLIDANLQALQMGRNWAALHLSHPLPIRVRAADAVGDRIFVDGNTAAALGCVYGGATVCAWYPITPSSSCAEAFQAYCQKYRVDKDTGENLFASGTLGALNFVIRGMRDLPGRKSIMLLSDGIPLISRDERGMPQSSFVLSMMRRLTDLANRASVV